MLHVVRRDPRAFGIEGTRWTLAAIHDGCEWLRTGPPGSLAGVLDRLGVVWQRARAHGHRPDPAYDAKVATLAALVRTGRALASGQHPAATDQAWLAPWETLLAATPAGRLAVLFEDECSVYRPPTLAHAFAARGHDQALAERSLRSDSATRLMGTLDATDGRVVARQHHVLGTAELVAFYRQVCAGSPETQLFIIQDHWPQHIHPDVLVALAPQCSPWPRYQPPNWPTAPSAAARKRWGDLRLPIQLVPLPTDASWCNPIEKLWRKLKQDHRHLHRFAAHLAALRACIDAFFAPFAHGAPDLLRYVGLTLPRFNC